MILKRESRVIFKWPAVKTELPRRHNRTNEPVGRCVFRGALLFVYANKHLRGEENKLRYVCFYYML